VYAPVYFSGRFDLQGLVCISKHRSEFVTLLRPGLFIIIYCGKHWLNILSFSVKKLVEDLNFFSPIFSAKKQVKNVKVLLHFPPHFCFKSKKCENVLHFSPVFSLEKYVKKIQIFHQFFH
jgi:hypothetical protein